MLICVKCSCVLPYFTQWNDANHFIFNNQYHHHPKLIPKQLPPFPWLITPLPLRGGAGGEALFPSLHSTKGLGIRLKIAGVSALFPLHHFPFHYQPRHAHDCFTTQLRWYCAIISMDEFRNINALMVQLGTSCSFDSPGLARNEPTPGKHSQGDSTP